MNDAVAELRAEHEELAELARTLTPAQWRLPTKFYGWTPWDEIAHLCYFDETGLLSVSDPEGFLRDKSQLTSALASGSQISDLARDKYGHLDGAALLAHWEPIAVQLVNALGKLDPKSRLTWYGPSMSARSFATARLMETWAHGQDMWDVLAHLRPTSSRLKHIAHLGVTTFGWTFVNRGLPVPQIIPFVELDGPDNAVWTWGDPSSSEWVRGLAQDFCLLVTQRRNLSDTKLRHTGGSAHQWLMVAQCFAGAPVEGPAPGVRRLDFT